MLKIWETIKKNKILLILIAALVVFSFSMNRQAVTYKSELKTLESQIEKLKADKTALQNNNDIKIKEVAVNAYKKSSKIVSSDILHYFNDMLDCAIRSNAEFERDNNIDN